MSSLHCRICLWLVIFFQKILLKSQIDYLVLSSHMALSSLFFSSGDRKPPVTIVSVCGGGEWLWGNCDRKTGSGSWSLKFSDSRGALQRHLCGSPTLTDAGAGSSASTQSHCVARIVVIVAIVSLPFPAPVLWRGKMPGIPNWGVATP